MSPVKELTDYENKRKQFAEKLQASKRSSLALRDKKVQANLRRSPI